MITFTQAKRRMLLSEFSWHIIVINDIEMKKGIKQERSFAP